MFRRMKRKQSSCSVRKAKDVSQRQKEADIDVLEVCRATTRTCAELLEGLSDEVPRLLNPVVILLTASPGIISYPYKSTWRLR